MEKLPPSDGMSMPMGFGGELCITHDVANDAPPESLPNLKTPRVVWIGLVAAGPVLRHQLGTV